MMARPQFLGFRNALCLLGLLLVGPGGALRAAERGEPLLRLVGADVGFCLEATDLKSQRAGFANSELFRRLQHTATFQKWVGSRDFQKLLQAPAALEKLAGEPFGTLFDNLFGQAVVLAVYPSDQHKPTGVLLTRAASKQALQAGLATWNRIDPQTLARERYADAEYFSRTKTAAGGHPAEVLYYVPLEEVLAISDDPGEIQRVIDLANSEKAGPEKAVRLPSLNDSESFRGVRNRLTAGTENALYLNPRAWDGVLHLEAIAADADPGAQAFVQIWKRCTALGIGLRIREGVVGELVAHYNSADLPAPWQQFVVRSAVPREFLEQVPRNALLAGAGPNDLALLGSVLASQFSSGKNRDWDRIRQIARGLLLGRDLFDDVLPKFESVGVYLVPRRDLQSAGVPPEVIPFDALAAFTLPKGTGTADDVQASAGLRESLENALQTGLNLLAATANAQTPATTALVRSLDQDGLLVRWAEGCGPYQPAYALTGNQLLVASSPQLIRDFAQQLPRDSLAAAPLYVQQAKQYFPDENHVLIVNLMQARQFLTEQQRFLVQRTAASHSVSEAEAAKRLHHIHELLQLVDAGFIAGQLRDGTLRIVVGGVLYEPAAR